MLWLDAVPFTHFRRTNASHLAGTDREEDSAGLRGEPEGVPITARDQPCSAPSLFSSNNCCQKVVGLVAWSLRVRKPTCGHEFRQDLQQRGQHVIKLATALIRRKFPVP